MRPGVFVLYSLIYKTHKTVRGRVDAGYASAV